MSKAQSNGVNTVGRSEMAVVPATREVELPKVTVDSMSKSELKEFIPELLKIVTGREDVWHSRRSAKPDWWPAEVSWATSKADWFMESYWTDNLRSVVRNCYKHMGKEDLLYEPKVSRDVNLNREIVTESPAKPQSYTLSQLKLPKGMFLPFSAEVFICYFCEMEFYDKEEMRAHQKTCQDRPPDLQKFPSSLSPNPAAQQGPPPISPKPQLEGEYMRLPLDKFINYLDLLPQRQAAKLKLRTRNSLDINCEDLGDLGPQCPLSPVTPRTPKSLISQMSREDPNSSSRKRLSYSMSIERDSVSIESESESSSSDSDDAEENASAKPKELNLLNIDITSLLGQRVKPHVHVESPVQVVRESESYCRTPVKNSFLDKLRKKPPSYPIMYKPRRIANLSKQNHMYKFTKVERKDFYDYINTGLNKVSREKLKKMKQFRILLPRLTEKKMLRWVPKRVLYRQLKGKHVADKKPKTAGNYIQAYSFYPQGPMLLSKNVDRILGLKKKSASRESERLRSPLSITNYISEEMEAELSKQKLTLYRSLLYEVEEYKAGKVPQFVENVTIESTKPVEEEHAPRLLNITEKISGKRDYIPIADRVFVTEKDDKPKSGMSVLRALLRKNKEDSLKPLADKNPTTVDNAVTVKSPTLNQLSKSLQSDLVKGLNLNKSTDDGSASSSCMSSPGSFKSGDENMSPSASLTKAVNKTPVMEDSISIISVSSDGESPIVNCCVGCNRRGENNKGSIPLSTDKNVSKFTEPLTVNVDGEFDILTKTRPDLKVDVTYGVPSPVPSSTESPLPSTPQKKSSKPKELVKRLLERESESGRRVTRSNSSAILTNFDELDQVLKASEPAKRESKLVKSLSENVECPKMPMKRESSLKIKTVESPKSSPKKENKRDKSNDNMSGTPKPCQKKEKLNVETDIASVTPKKEKLAKSIDGTYEIHTKSRKDVKEGESPLKSILRSSTLYEKVPQVKPIRKSQSLTPSPSPKKLEPGVLKVSLRDTPNSSPKKLEEKAITAEAPSPKKGDSEKIVIHTPEKGDSEKTVIQLRSSTLLTPTKMTIRTRSVSVDSNGKVDDNQYSLRSGNFVIDSPRRSCDSPRGSGSESAGKNSPKTNSAKKDSKMSKEIITKIGQNANRSPRKSASTASEVTRKIDFSLKTDSNVDSPSRRPKRMMSIPVEETNPAKLRKVSSDMVVKFKV